MKSFQEFIDEMAPPGPTATSAATAAYKISGISRQLNSTIDPVKRSALRMKLLAAKRLHQNLKKDNAPVKAVAPAAPKQPPPKVA